MKKTILIVGALLLVGCGPSQQEKERIAEMACAEIMATRNFEEARRIKILNEARLEVGLDPIVSSSLFETNIRLGGRSSCIDYIIPPPPPPPKTKAQREAEEAAAEERKQRAEERRLEREEEERKRAEERKIKEEQERIAREERERQEEQRRLEEERLKAEKIRLAEEKKIREEEERRRYVEENTVTTHLYCPSKSKKSRRSEESKWFRGYVINKLDDEYLMSEVYTSDQTVDLQKAYKSCVGYPVNAPANHAIGVTRAEIAKEMWKKNYSDRNEYEFYLIKIQEWKNKRYNSRHPQLERHYFPKFKNPLWCENVGNVDYKMYFYRTIPELMILDASYGKINLVDESILLFGSDWGNQLNRETLISGNQYESTQAPCEVITKEEFESKVMIPLKEMFDSVVEPAKQQHKLLQEQLQKIEKKI